MVDALPPGLLPIILWGQPLSEQARPVRRGPRGAHRFPRPSPRRSVLEPVKDAIEAVLREEQLQAVPSFVSKVIQVRRGVARGLCQGTGREESHSPMIQRYPSGAPASIAALSWGHGACAPDGEKRSLDSDGRVPVSNRI